MDIAMGDQNIMASLLTTTGCFGVITNIAQLVLFSRDKKRRKCSFGLTLLSLNTADLLASIGLCLLGTSTLLFISMMIDLALLEALMKAAHVALAFSLTSSMTHVGFIAVERVIAVAFPFKVKQIITTKRCFITLALMWVTSVLLAIGVFFLEQLGFMLLAGVSLVTGVALVVIYTMVCCRYSMVCCRTVRRSSASNVAIPKGFQRRRRHSEKEVLVYSAAITVVYIVCNYPKAVNQFISYPKHIRITSDLLLSINPLLDPLLYFMSSYCRRKKENERSASIASQQRRAAEEMQILK